LIQAGVEAGAFVRDDEGAIAFSEAQAPVLRRFYAQQLAALLSSAAATEAAFGL
jgi:hypothetical protein